MDLSQLPDFSGGLEIHDISDGAIVPGRVDSDAAISRSTMSAMRKRGMPSTSMARCTRAIAP
jgi:hypothetical protein